MPSATVPLESKAIDAMMGVPGAALRAASMRDPDLVEVAERLEHEQVDAAFDERRRLLGERRATAARARPRLATPGTSPVGPIEPGDVRVVARHLAREPRAGEVVRAHLAAEAVPLEAEAVRAERVGLDDLRARAPT